MHSPENQIILALVLAGFPERLGAKCPEPDAAWLRTLWCLLLEVAMYCSACGQPMDPYQPYCPRCGRQVTAIPTAPPPPWIWSRVHRHVHTLGILWIVYAGWTLLHWMMVAPFLSGMMRGWFPFQHGFDGFVFPFQHVPWIIPLITVILAGRAILSLVAGYALLRRYPWARTLAIVTAFLTLIRPITGTALAIYTLWVLLPSASGHEYEQIATPSL